MRRGTDLFECGESSLRSFSRLLQCIEQSRDRLVDGSRSDRLLGGIESLSGGGSNHGIRIDQSTSDDFDDGSFVRFELGFRGVAHDLGEREADTFSLTTIDRRHRFLQNRDDFSENGFSQLSTCFGETTSSGLCRKASVHISANLKRR